jgi:putative hemolysin
MEPLPAIFIILGLIILSGFFSLFYSALNACRRPFLLKEAREGKTKRLYEAVLDALDNPRILSATCRLWINLPRIVAVFLTAFYIMQHAQPAGHFSAVLIIAASILLISLTILLLGDIIPKLAARAAPERIAATLLPLPGFFSLPLRPFNYLILRFGAYLRSVFHLEAGGRGITADELRLALDEGEKSGIVESQERTMVEGVFYLGDRPIGAFMTHRSEIQWLDVNAPPEEIRAKALEHRSQRCFPVTNGSPDEIVGAVYLEDIILDQAEASPRGLRAIMTKAQFVPETMSALKAFESIKNSQVNILLIMDEYGGLARKKKKKALVEEIVGDLCAPQHEKKPFIRLENGAWLADGFLNIDEAVEALSLSIDNAERSSYHTLAGFVLSLAGELPGAGDSFVYQGYRFIVKEMVGNRIDKLLITSLV